MKVAEELVISLLQVGHDPVGETAERVDGDAR
jgi:hypothetical protein